MEGELNMTRDDAFSLMLFILKEVVVDVDIYAQHAKNRAARSAALVRAQRIRDVIKQAEEAQEAVKPVIPQNEFTGAD
jgi:hypothetical protein